MQWSYAKRDFGSRVITAAALQRLAAGSFLADRAEASPAHCSADPEPPMLASLQCKQSGVRPSWNGATAQTDAQTNAGQIIYRCASGDMQQSGIHTIFIKSLQQGMYCRSDGMTAVVNHLFRPKDIYFWQTSCKNCQHVHTSTRFCWHAALRSVIIVYSYYKLHKKGLDLLSKIYFLARLWPSPLSYASAWGKCPNYVKRRLHFTRCTIDFRSMPSSATKTECKSMYRRG